MEQIYFYKQDLTILAAKHKHLQLVMFVQSGKTGQQLGMVQQKEFI